MNRRTGLVLSAMAVFVLALALAANSYAAQQGQKAHASATKKHKKPKPKRGPKGPAGPAGPTGPAGAAGKEGPAGKEGKDGKEGPSGVLSMDQFSLEDGPTNTGTEFAFSGKTVTESFDAKTTAHVTASVDLGTFTTGRYSSFIGVCYEPVGGSEPVNVSFVEPELELAAFEYIDQSVSGVVKGLAPGQYEVGFCTKEETSGLFHGYGIGTIIVAETR